MPCPNPPLMKCCGITTLVDVQSVVALGFDYAGFIRVPNTPRYVTPAFLKEASLYTMGGSTSMVAVYHQADVSQVVLDVSETPGLSVVQLHGDESVAYVQELHDALPQGIKLWKVFNLLSPPDDETLQAYAPYLNAIVLDLPKGFTGVFSWEDLASSGSVAIVKAIALAHHHGLLCLLAGKLTPILAGQVLESYTPDGLDVASGVEALPGQKDYALLQAFVHQAL
jgi:phosphoribosylanthranilate isomerase